MATLESHETASLAFIDTCLCLVLPRLPPCRAGLRHHGLDAHVFGGAKVLRMETSTLVGLGLNAFYALDQLHPELAVDVRSRGQPTLDISGQARVPGREPETRTLPNNGLLAIRLSEVHAFLASFVRPEAVHCGYQGKGLRSCGRGSRKETGTRTGSSSQTDRHEQQCSTTGSHQGEGPSPPW